MIRSTKPTGRTAPIASTALARTTGSSWSIAAESSMSHGKGSASELSQCSSGATRAVSSSRSTVKLSVSTLSTPGGGRQITGNVRRRSGKCTNESSSCSIASSLAIAILSRIPILPIASATSMRSGTG